MRIAFLVVVIAVALVAWWLHRRGVSWWDVRAPLVAWWGRAWRWLVWSPRRIAIGLVLILALGWAWSRFGADQNQPAAAVVDAPDLPTGWKAWPTASDQTSGHPPTPAATAPASSSPTTPAASSTATAGGQAPDVPVGDEGAPAGKFPGAQDPAIATPAVLAAAAAFLPVWGGSGTPEQRHTALVGVATADLASTLAPIPVDQIPHQFGPPALQSLDRSTAVVVVPMLDLRGTAILRITADGNRWLVSAVSRAETSSPASASPAPASPAPASPAPASPAPAGG